MIPPKELYIPVQDPFYLGFLKQDIHKVYTSCLQHQDLCLGTYLDDWLLCRQSWQQVTIQTKLLISHVEELGLNVSHEKTPDLLF